MKKLFVLFSAIAFLAILVFTATAFAQNKWQWPTTGKIISVPGMRHQPVTGEYRMHHGVDIANEKGTKIYAARTGRVVGVNRSARRSSSNEGGGYGNYVIIRHRAGLYSIYAHLKKDVVARKGQWVHAGDLLGYMGMTGLTNTVHLHFGIGPTYWVNTRTLDPRDVLPKR